MSVTIPNDGSMPVKHDFSQPEGVVMDGAFLKAAQASRYSADPVFREDYYCDLIGECDFGTWLTENMGYAETCFRDYSIVRDFATDNIVHLKNGAPVVVPASPGTATLPIANNSHYVGGAYVFPQRGDALLLPPEGNIAIVKAVNTGVNSTTLTIQLQNSPSSVTVPANADVIVLTGKELADCDCPSGLIRFNDSPLEQPISMIDLSDATGEICGRALLECQNVKYAYKYKDAKGCVQETEVWYGGTLQEMYQNHEKSKLWRYLFNSTFGIIPTLKAKSIRWNWADPENLSVEDIDDLKTGAQSSGLNCFEYTFMLGSQAFASAQTLANELGTGRVSYGSFDPAECKWINLMYCTISTNGMTIHFYEECAFGSGKMLGAAGFAYRNRGIGIPMCKKPTRCRSLGPNDNKLFTVVNWRDELGRLHDNLTDSDGILNGPGGRNTFGAGCDKHNFSIKSAFSVEVSCPEAWVLVNFPL